jgi:hypothetical protein
MTQISLYTAISLVVVLHIEITCPSRNMFSELLLFAFCE